MAPIGFRFRYAFPNAPTGQKHDSPGQSEAAKPRSAALGTNAPHSPRPERAKQEKFGAVHAWHVIGIVSFLCRIVASLGLGGGLDLEQLIERRGVRRFVPLAGIDPRLLTKF